MNGIYWMRGLVSTTMGQSCVGSFPQMPLCFPGRECLLSLPYWGGMQTVGDSHKAQHLRKSEMFKCLQKRIKACSSTNKFRKSYPCDFWIDVPLYILGDKCQGVLHFKKSYSKKRPWTRIIICSFEFDLKPHEIPTWRPMGLSYHRSWTWGELNVIIRNQGRLRRSCFIHNECISFTKWGHVFEGAE